MVTPPVEPISVLVVDDEAPARQRLVDLLRKEPLAGQILEAEDGLRAVETIQSRQPGLVFLDVQMPELNGLGVVDAVGPECMPLTVFVTAYDQHAIRAFEANALDYLLKPFSDERYEATMTRVKCRLEQRNAKEFEQRIARMVSTVPQQRRLDRFVIKSAGTTRFVRAAEIDWIEAAGVYVNLHIAGRGLLYRATLNELEDKLDPLRFVRVHRSAIVNIESVVQLEPISHGEFEVVLKDGSRTRISRSYRAQMEQRLGQSL
jgi:two-component system LytT family response regulator